MTWHARNMSYNTYIVFISILCSQQFLILILYYILFYILFYILYSLLLTILQLLKHSLRNQRQLNNWRLLSFPNTQHYAVLSRHIHCICLNLLPTHKSISTANQLRKCIYHVDFIVIINSSRIMTKLSKPYNFNSNFINCTNYLYMWQVGLM